MPITSCRPCPRPPFVSRSVVLPINHVFLGGGGGEGEWGGGGGGGGILIVLIVKLHRRQ